MKKRYIAPCVHTITIDVDDASLCASSPTYLQSPLGGTFGRYSNPFEKDDSARGDVWGD